jgi:hypothetical protein
MQTMKHTFTLLRLECCVQCLLIGIFGPFSSKNINPELCIDIVHEFLARFTVEEIAKLWFQQEDTTFHRVRATIR